MSRATIILGSLLAVTLVACGETTATVAPAEARSLAVLPTVCAKVTLPVTSIVVVDRVMPAMLYTVTNCGSRRITVVVTPYEAFGELSEVCPAPMPAPARLTISARRSTTASFATLRGSCGFLSSLQRSVFVQGENSWQVHRLMVSVRNSADGTLLSTTPTPFIWQDAN